MVIRVSNAEQGLMEEFRSDNLNFIRRSYEEFESIGNMTEEDYKKLAILIVRKRYTDTRFDNLEWKAEVVAE